MPLKPLAAMCRIREQIIEDLPSGLTLQFELFEGGVRLTVTGRSLAVNREILFDGDGRLMEVRPAKHAFRRPSWMH
jgi:hypothetical protein